MKTLFFILILVLNFNNAHAKGNPFYNYCNSVGGNSEVLVLENDQILICNFGEAGIGALDLWQYKDGKISSQAVIAFLNSEKELDQNTACSNASGKIIVTSLLTNTESKRSICRFYDHSFIDANTLANGKDSQENEFLKNLLEQK